MKTKFNDFIYYLASFMFFATLSGCIATSREMVNLREDIYYLQQRIEELQVNQAEVVTKMESLNNSMTNLSEKLNETKMRMSLLSQRFDDIQANLIQRMDIMIKQTTKTPPVLAPVPSQLYQLAYSDYIRGKYDLAIVGFRTYLEKYPTSELSNQAQYYLSDCYYAKGNWQMCLTEIEIFISSYPVSDLKPAALMKKALCLIKTDKIDLAKTTLEEIITKYAASDEAKQAQEKLATLK